MKERVLVLDDEPSVLEVLGQHLGDEGYDCTLTTSASKALDALRKGDYALLLTDLRMPDMHGIEVVQRAKKHDPELAVIVVTATVEVTNAIEALRAGADDYLLKPFNLAGISVSVEKALERRQLVIENRRHQQELESRVRSATTDLQKMNRELRSTKEYLENLLHSSLDAIVTVDHDQRISFANKGATYLLGYTEEELTGMPIARLLVGGAEEGRHLRRLLQEGQLLQNYETEITHKSERQVPINMSLSLVKDPDGAVMSTLAICKDITEQKRLENELKEMSIKDSLTALYNQRYFYSRLEAEIERAKRQGHRLSLLLFDIDQFKTYNDCHGHLEGDRVLRTTGQVVMECTRGHVDIGFRYGGDEFTVILPEADEQQALTIAERIRATFEAKRFDHLTLSIGLMSYRTGSSLRSFIRFTDAVMYEAKRSGGNKVYICNPDNTPREVAVAGQEPLESSETPQEKGRTVKLGICNEIFKEWNDITRTIHYVKEIGYDGLEIAPFTLSQYVADIPARTRQEIVASAAEADLDIIGIHWVFVGPEGVHLTHPDAEVRAFTVQYLIDLIHFCGDIGGSVLIFGSPKQRNVGRDVTYSQAFDYARAIFSQAMRTCEERGVTICMEQLTHLETNFCQTVEETVELIEAVNHPNFQLLLDTKAMAFQPKSRPQLIHEYGKYLRHYHANDDNMNGPGWGDVDFGPIFEALRDIDYHHYVSVEVFKFEPGPETIATRSLEYLKRHA